MLYKQLLKYAKSTSISSSNVKKQSNVKVESVTGPTIGRQPQRIALRCHGLRNLNIRILNLPFDLAQGGELVEPFRISCFEFVIYHELIFS